MEASDSNNRRTLLIGDINRAISDTPNIRELPCDVCGDMADGIKAAAHKAFAAVAVIMPGRSEQLASLLQALRKSSPHTRIVLLAEMHQEPLAIKFVDECGHAGAVADDYVIYPISAADLFTAIVSAPRPPAAQVIQPSPVPEGRQGKISRLEKLATEDDLTGLKNRRYIREFARQVIERAGRDNSRVTLLLFDIDNLKSYNDAYGHLAGDEILKEAAVLMRRCCRRHDAVGRIGGDEFAVVFWDGPRARSAGAEAERRLANAEHPKQAISVAMRFRTELKKAKLDVLGPKGRGLLTISGALASFPRDGLNAPELFQKADKALLEAKRSGKNRIYLVGEPQNDISAIQ